MYFEKVKFEAFEADIRKYLPAYEMNIEDYYNNIQIPERKTQSSAGYDFYSPVPFVLVDDHFQLVPTGIKCRFSKDESQHLYLGMYIRSSIGIKHQIMLMNGTGIIDADYYGNPDNDGDIVVALYNYGRFTFTCHAGDRIAQGVFHSYYKTVDDVSGEVRTGGIGSTDVRK